MSIRYKLESVVETELILAYEYNFSVSDPDKLHVRIGHEIKPIMDEEKVTVKVKASYVYGDDEILLVSNTILMTFCLHPMCGLIQMKGNGTFSCQDTSIIDTFLTAAIGALRGILIKNLKNTPLDGYYLPLIPLDILKSES